MGRVFPLGCVYIIISLYTPHTQKIQKNTPKTLDKKQHICYNTIGKSNLPIPFSLKTDENSVFLCKINKKHLTNKNTYDIIGVLKEYGWLNESNKSQFKRRKRR